MQELLLLFLLQLNVVVIQWLAAVGSSSVIIHLLTELSWYNLTTATLIL